MQTRRARLIRVAFVVAAMLTAGEIAAGSAATGRFASKGRVLDAPATWLTRDREHMVAGSGTRVTVQDLRGGYGARRVVELARPVTDGLLAGRQLYVVITSNGADALAVGDVSAPTLEFVESGLRARAGSALTLAQMDDHLLVVENGVGVHVLAFPQHHAAHSHGSHPAPEEVGFLAFEEPVLALAASSRTIWIATDHELVRVGASVPALPTLVRRVPAPARARSMDAPNGQTLHLLSDEGLWIVDVADHGVSTVAGSVPAQSLVTALDPGVRGDSILTLGRSVFVATPDGVLRFQDTSSLAAVFTVQVGDVFFSPPGALNINVGDTVQWQKPGTIFTHNVRSCTAAQSGCGGLNATQSFTSGAVTTAPFNYSFTFGVPGNNPYVCQTHALTMTGNVVVAAAGPQPPPAVPDGGLFAPLTVSKLNAGGAALSISFDTGCPDGVGHDLIYGTSATLPAVPGGTYGLTGSACATGGSPFNWTTSPAPAPGTFVWWVVVTDDGGSIEGSWGRDGAGSERNGPGLNGSSGACGNTDKDLTNTCGV